MAIALDHVSSSSGHSTGDVVSVTSSTGNLMIVTANLGAIGGVGQITSITDNKGNVYVPAGPRSVAVTSAVRTLEVWYAKGAATGITSITVNFSGGATNSAFAYYDCSGADATNPLAAYAPLLNTQASSVSAVGPTIAVPTGGGIVVAVDSNNCSAVSSGFTLDSGVSGGFAHNVNAGSGTFAATFTQTNSDYIVLMAAFKSTVGVPLLFQSFSQGNSSPLTITATKTGSLLVVIVYGSSTAVVSGITDNASGGSNAYQNCLNSDAVQSGVQTGTIWYAMNSHPGATQVTFSFSAGSIGPVDFFEFTGADLSGPFDVANHISNQTAGTSGPPYLTPITLTTNFAQEIVVSGMIQNNGYYGRFVADPFIPTPNPFGGVAAFCIVTSSGLQTATWYNDTSGDACLSTIASFMIATSSGAGPASYAFAVQDDAVWLGGDE